MIYHYNEALPFEGVTQCVTDGWDDDLCNPVKLGEPVPHHFVTFYFNSKRGVQRAVETGGEIERVADGGIVADDGGEIVFWIVRWIDYAPAFKAQHGLTDEEFADPVNQTLFAIQYPEARS